MLLAFSGFVLLLSVALGYGTWAADPVLAKQTMEQVINEQFMVLIEKMADLNWWGQFLVILLNNLKATLLIIVSGAFLPFVPLLVGILPNGFVIGLLAGLYEYELGVPKSTFFLSLLPHGLFEIPAILLAVTISVLWGVRNWRSIFRGEKARTSWAAHAKASLAFFPLILALLIIAALVEVLVTPLIFNLPSFV
nr:stage II sporulation protein M [Capillibacterium thermochitinicola]